MEKEVDKIKKKKTGSIVHCVYFEMLSSVYGMCITDVVTVAMSI